MRFWDGWETQNVDNFRKDCNQFLKGESLNYIPWAFMGLTPIIVRLLLDYYSDTIDKYKKTIIWLTPNYDLFSARFAVYLEYEGCLLRDYGISNPP